MLFSPVMIKFGGGLGSDGSVGGKLASALVGESDWAGHQPLFKIMGNCELPRARLLQTQIGALRSGARVIIWDVHHQKALATRIIMQSSLT